MSIHSLKISVHKVHEFLFREVTLSPQTFRTPRRRSTRQRSGYHVSGEKSGNEAIIKRARKISVASKSICLLLTNTTCSCPPQFNEDYGMAATGGYIKAETDLSIKVTLLVYKNDNDEDAIVSSERTISVPANHWRGFGTHIEVPLFGNTTGLVDLKANICIYSDGPIGDIQLFGVNLDPITAYESQDTRSFFDTKTDIYIPGIYYFQEDEAFIIEPSIRGDVTSTQDGEQIVLKSCNRCARFLIVDVFDEPNGLGYSNHCAQRAPCSHNAFSRYQVENSDGSDIDKVFWDTGKIISDGQSVIVSTYLGFQLECRTCKKFKVNAPLNPLRNGTQHREDSLRRRAFEQLLMHLLGHDWIFFQHRQQYKNEFDVYIWNKFNCQCFGCGKPLSSTHEMDLDHTLPLNYLWPLDDTATCLCKTCNSQKNNKFPFEFTRYQETGKLEELAAITGLDPKVVAEPMKRINIDAVVRLRERIVWFFDTFLMEDDYQKERQGKKVADLVVASLQRVFNDVNVGWNLVEEYTKVVGAMPTSVSIAQIEVDTQAMLELGTDV